MGVLLVIGWLTAIGLGWALFWIGFTHRRFLAYHRRTGRNVPPLGWSGVCLFHLRTLRSIALVAWWMAITWWRDGLRVPAGEITGGPVLCVHGYHMVGSSLWGIRRDLESRGRPTQAVFLGLPCRDQEAYARPLRRVLRSLREARPGEPIDVVAHSMGGVILRLVLANDPELAACIRRIVTLGAPHRGTALLRWFRSGSLYQMLSRKSEFLRDLPDFQTVTPQAEVLTVATVHDLVVYPLETAHLPGAEQVTFERIGHLGLLTERSVRRVVVEWLDRPHQPSRTKTG